MQILLSDNKYIVGYAPKITFGIYDEPIEKWRLADESDRVMYYIIDHNYELVINVVFPDDYEEGKYFYVDGVFVLNENWQPYISDEDRLYNLEESNKATQDALVEQQEVSAVLEEELLNTQIALTEQYETNLAMEEELINTQIALTEQYEANLVLEEELSSARDEITDLQMAICELYESIVI